MKNIIICLLLLISFSVQAQLNYGFKAGLNYSKIEGPSELGANQEELESNDYAGGFMVGAIFKYPITDLVGIKWELLYSQKGTKYNFEGTGYQILPTEGGAPLSLTGNQRIDLNVTNSYLDIPVLAYWKFGKFELEGGANIGILLGSTGSGELEFNGAGPLGTPIEPFTLILDYRFRRDDPGEVDFVNDGSTPINVDGRALNVPRILKSYYLFSEDRGSYYNAIDIGLNAGLNYFWNQTLYIGARFNYGLLDVQSDDYDISRANLDNNGNFITRSDKDRNISLQFSLGFSF